MRRLTLHIGIPKTGSSAIQVFLAQNRDLLLHRGLDYLPIGEFKMGLAGKISAGNGAFVARSLVRSEAQSRIADPERHLRDLANAVAASTAGHMLISSELFSNADLDLLENFLHTLRAQQITPAVCYFIREQDQYLMSSFTQQVKRHHYTGTATDFVQRAMRNVPYIRYFRHYGTLCRLFGRENVHLRIFEEALGGEGGIFRALLDAIGVDADGLTYETMDVNTVISGRELALMLALNKFKPRMRFSDMLVQNAQALGTSRSGHVHGLLPPETMAAIAGYYQEENRLLAREYFDREVLFPARPAADAQAGATPSIEDFSNADLIELFGGLLIRMDERLSQLERPPRDN